MTMAINKVFEAFALKGYKKMGAWDQKKDFC